MNDTQHEVIQDCFNAASLHLINSMPTSEAIKIFEFFEDDSISSQNPDDDRFQALLEGAPDNQNMLANLRSMQLEAPITIQHHYGEEELAFDVVIGQGAPLNLDHVGPIPQPGEVRNALIRLATNTISILEITRTEGNDYLNHETFPDPIRQQRTVINILALNQIIDRLAAVPDQTNRALKAALLSRCERTMCHIINTITTQGSREQKHWLVAHRQLISNLTSSLDRKRSEWRIPRTNPQEIAGMWEALNRELFNAARVFDDHRIFGSYATIKGLRYFLKGMSFTSLTTAGASGITVAAFPPAAPVVAAGVGGAGTLVSAGCGMFGRYVGRRDAIANAEQVLIERHNPALR